MQTPPETMLPKESNDSKPKPVETKKEDIVPRAEEVPKAPAKDPEPKPPTTGNGGEAVKTQESNSTAEPKAKTPEVADSKPKVAEQPKPAPKVAEQPKSAPKVAEQPKPAPDVPEQAKPAPKDVETVRNSKPETSPKPPAEQVSASKSADKTPAEEEPMETEDGGDDDGDKKKAEKTEPKKKEISAEAKEEKIPAKRGRKRKADIEQKEIEVETLGSRTKRTREASEEKQEAVPETRRGRKRAAKTEVSMREAPGSEDEDGDEEEDDDQDDDDEPVKKKRGRGRPPKSGKPAAAKPVKQPRHTGPTLEIPTVEGNTIACAAGDGEVGQLGIGEQGENGKSRFVAIGDIPDKVVRCAAGGMHSLLLTEKGEIYSFGCNDDGSLGRPTENEEECFVPKLTPLSAPVAKLAAGNIHSVALTKTCKVFIWGSYRDNNGAFGIQPDGDAPLRTPTELKVPETIVDVACGSEHTLLLSNKGNIFSMGVGEHGRLGRLKSSHCGRENRRARQTLLTPVIVPMRKRKIKFDRIWAGRFNSFARTTDGAIWGCGLNNYGQLGELDAKVMEDNFVFFLTELKSFDPKIKWEQICGGEQHTLALDADGSVYSLGRVLYGRLGLGKKEDNDPDVKKPTLIPELEKKCSLIAAGDHTSFALDKDGQLWSWGQGTNLLGQGSRDEADTMDVFVPTACTSKALRENKVVFASAGSNHALCVVKSE